MTTKEEPTDAQIQRLREAVFAQSQRERQHPDGRAGLYYPSIEAARTMLLAAAPDHQAEAPSDAEVEGPTLIDELNSTINWLKRRGDLHDAGRVQRAVAALAARPVVDDAATVDRVAEAIAKAADADYWTDEIRDWEASDEWEREAHPDNYPGMAYEDREAFRSQARAALGVVFEQTHQPEENE